MDAYVFSASSHRPASASAVIADVYVNTFATGAVLGTSAVPSSGTIALSVGTGTLELQRIRSRSSSAVSSAALAEAPMVPVDAF